MANIQLFSDLHLDASRLDIEVSGADIVLIVGDTAFEDHHYDWLFRKLGGKPTIVVPGNHDYDGWDITTRDTQLKALCQEYEQVYYLNNESITLQGIKFIGSCLWTDFKIDAPHISFEDTLEFASTIAHLKTIKKNGKSLTPHDVIELHEKAVAYLSYELLHNQPAPEVPVVVATHFAPSPQSISKRYALSNNAYHAVNMERLMGLSDYWFHGHIHDSSSYTVEATKVRCNPRGYSPTFNLNQNIEFEPKKIFELSPEMPAFNPILVSHTKKKI